ncbi:Periplasmic [NiFe] hydrogenase small subunit [Pontiella desulfatans]|uniref:Periplasmic [NiFe] hydrogenase small subunit n=1 Tax=Pontiella desulfatans TaxID=2750659 RepID=A0A6C2UCH1_PONDE|nr:twin-arginine translocation signal domain-containing protein [Pontiella desulfatans]VGO17277.1 Periplasmic [NiFe] hydrogenase small subunit [Pontiella desulfatans]
MNLSRRRFLEYCGVAAGVIGLTPGDLAGLNEALADPNAPEVIWLHGSSCTGCSVSFLNYISDTAPETVVEVLAGAINLTHHATVMTFAGESCGAVLEHAAKRGNYILVLEGGVPTAFNGHCCVAYSYKGQEITYADAVTEMAAHASHVICAGTCSSFGGIPAAGSNPSGVIKVSEHIGADTINISGCPANPNWVVWAVVQLLLGNTVDLDADQRPVALYQQPRQGGGGGGSGVWETIHQSCPRKSAFNTNRATDFDDTDGKCLVDLGCRGQWTKAKCDSCWNGTEGNGHWCIGVNSPCIGCVEPEFPDSQSFFQPYSNPS